MLSERQVLQAVDDQLEALDLTIDSVQPDDLIAPLYDGDLEDAKGVPASIRDLNQRMQNAQTERSPTKRWQKRVQTLTEGFAGFAHKLA